MSLAKVIKARRVHMRMSQADLAQRVGVSRAAVGQWENGVTAPTRRHAPAVADALGLDVKDLFDATGSSLTMVDTDVATRQVALMAMDAFVAGERDVAGLLRVTVAGDLPADAVALRVEDSSMAPKYNAGDLVVVSRSVAPSSNDDVVADLGGQAVLRTYIDRGLDSAGNPVFDLLSTSSDHATVTCNSSNRFKVVATVVGHWRLTRR